MGYKLFFIVLVLVSSCNENAKTNECQTIQETEPNMEVVAADFVILKYRPQWHWTFKNATPTELTNSEFIDIEKFLMIAIKENNEKQRTELIEYNKNNPQNQRETTGYELPLEGYKRQYVPVVNAKGQKEVFINLFCDEFDDWKTELVQVEDGGNCYYHLKINLVTKKHTLEINYSL